MDHPVYLGPRDLELVSVDSRMTKNIVDLLARLGPIDRRRLTEEIGVGRSTVSRAIGQLLDARIAIELDTPPRGRGRPQTLLAVNPQVASAIGLYYGLRHVLAAIVDPAHRILGTAEAFLGLDYTVEDAIQTSLRLIAELEQQQTGPIVGVGLALPGPMDRTEMTLTYSSILPHWAGVQFLDLIRGHLPYPVVADNESNLAAHAEKLWGAATDLETIIFLKLHSGVGGAIVMHGQVVRGQRGAAGEFGHISRNPRGERCRCGRRGCLEASIGIPRLLEHLSEAHGRAISFPEALELLRDGDRACGDLIRTAGYEAGRALGTLCNVLDPRAIIVGGALTQAGEPLFSAITTGLRASALPMHNGIPLRTAVLGRFASALGATGLVMASGFDQLLARRWAGMSQG